MYLDGGIADRSGLQGMPEGKRVLFHHLSSRSPWRRRNSSALQIPERPGMNTLVLDRIPRVSPFKLEIGKVVFEQVCQSARQALDRPMVDGIVRL